MRQADLFLLDEILLPLGDIDMGDKVGIVTPGMGRRRLALMTWYSYHNYGTALQAAALCRVLGDFDFDVDVVNYSPYPEHIARPTPKDVNKLYAKLWRKAKARVLARGYVPKTREDLFDRFLDENLTLTEPCVTLAEFEGLNGTHEVFVCGSDQIWSPAGHNPRYFLDFAGDDRLKVAYAPSLGLPRIEDEDVARQMARLCGRIDALSTREESGSKIVADLTGREVATVVDPTLLIEGKKWPGIVGATASDADRAPYLLAYMLGMNERHWKRIYALGKALDLPVRLIPVFKKDLRRSGCIKSLVGPKEFVSLISGAAYVCTDSFHGVAFSINMNRDFCVFERFKRGDSGSQNSRVYNILEKTGLEGRLATDAVRDAELTAPIDWAEPNERVAAERGRSLAWLEAALAMEPKPSARKNNVCRDRSLCCGCTACEVACPVDAIDISLDEEGFWRAKVDEAACVSCGKCRRACPFVEHGDAVPVGEGQLYSFKSSDNVQLLRSSSGGAGATIAKMLACDGAAALGCAYEDGHGAVGRLVEPGDAEGLASLAGSKYTQEEVGGSLALAARRGGPLAVFGAPCQVQAARNLMRGRDDVTYVDFVCHGVPTRHLLDRYADWLSSAHGLDRDTLHVDFRHKPKGWREIYIYTTDGAREHCEHQRRDPYFLMFEAGQCYAGCCYECPWRATSAADVRMADYWGPRFADDKTGVSMVLAMTERGREVVEGLREAGAVESQPFEDYRRYQQCTNNPAPVFRDALIERLANPSESISAVSDEFAEPLATVRDAWSRLDPLKRVVKFMIGRW